MTKRFKIDNNISLDEDTIDTQELSTLVDTENKLFYFIVDSISNVQSFCDRLNELADENKCLKKALTELKEIGDYQAIRIKELSNEINVLEKENNELKNTTKTYKKGNKLLKTTLDKTKKENTELKQFKKTTAEIIRKWNELLGEK